MNKKKEHEVDWAVFNHMHWSLRTRMASPAIEVVMKLKV